MTLDDVKRRIEALVILDRKEFGGKPHEAEDLKTLEIDLARWYERPSCCKKATSTNRKKIVVRLLTRLPIGDIIRVWRRETTNPRPERRR